MTLSDAELRAHPVEKDGDYAAFSALPIVTSAVVNSSRNNWIRNMREHALVVTGGSCVYRICMITSRAMPVPQASHVTRTAMPLRMQ